ncbi:poly(A) binding protein, cytoplasmic 1a isoform X1 [Silurus meridionalis]|uniref:RRM domain-containing protein n=1 Tax=Silurus meridionalis TaxID=175797 RepID=A0A8T0AVG2_SILME|nr:hypothetical protein HF521_005692 [Silurus meridionalis]KAI5096789.1 poly(A) binding protein, cytoplasmic 1a isoform X1 [Silurus meridionalis]
MGIKAAAARGCVLLNQARHEVTESMLMDVFSLAGDIHSVSVCRDWNTGTSLGYAYVNFYQQEDAERALATLDSELLMGQPMRVRWSQKVSSMKKSSTGSLFIKKLDMETIDSMALYDLFLNFGRILSCKKETVDLFVTNLDRNIDDECLRVEFSKFGTVTNAKIITNNGRSKGFGFVRFSSFEEAMQAKSELNGQMLGQKQMFVDVAHQKEKRRRTKAKKQVK